MTKKQYLDKRKNLIDKAQKFLDSGDMESYKKTYSEIQTLDTDYENAAKEQANLNALDDSVKKNPFEMGGKMNDEKSYSSPAEMLGSLEYRTAFMNSVVSGTPIPEKFRNAAAQTVTGDVASVIPNVLVQKIFEKLDNYGEFLPMVTHTSYKGGVTIPTADINLEATWTPERGTTDDQRATTGTVTFAYHKLRCVVAESFEASTVTLEAFEETLVRAIVKAMTKAEERAIFLGEGAAKHQPEGFLTVTPPEGQTISVTEGKAITYADLVKAEAALPAEYESEAVWTMTKNTFFNAIVGMTDSSGQPIARVNSGIDGKPEYSILGRKVKFNKYMESFSTTVAKSTIVAAIFNFSDYCINTNRTITLKKYVDEDTDDVKTKALALVDGKVIDKSSLVIMRIDKKSS